MALSMPVNASDVTAGVYGRRRPKYPVITETLGLALVLLVNRNTAAERGVWLGNLVVSDSLCDVAETFAGVLQDRPSPEGWRGGALASLRTLAPGAVHDEVAEMPWSSHQMVTRFWLDDDEGWYREPIPRLRTRPPIRTELARRLAGLPRLTEAWDALEEARRRVMPQLCGMGSAHERPSVSRKLHEELIEGRDVAAEHEAYWERLMAESEARRAAS